MVTPTPPGLSLQSERDFKATKKRRTGSTNQCSESVNVLFPAVDETAMFVDELSESESDIRLGNSSDDESVIHLGAAGVDAELHGSGDVSSTSGGGLYLAPEVESSGGNHIGLTVADESGTDVETDGRDVWQPGDNLGPFLRTGEKMRVQLSAVCVDLCLSCVCISGQLVLRDRPQCA